MWSYLFPEIPSHTDAYCSLAQAQPTEHFGQIHSRASQEWPLGVATLTAYSNTNHVLNCQLSFPQIIHSFI